MANPPSPTFCVMPWTNLATETDGKCKICCVVPTKHYIKKENGEDFHIHKDSIHDIYQSKYVKNIRQQMLKGEWPEDCGYCRSQEAQQGESPRIRYNKRWLTEDLHKTEPTLPISLEPRPGTTCNLKCNTCWSMSSSKVYSERKAALEGELPDFLKRIWSYEVRAAETADLNWSDREIYLANVRACMDNLHRLYFTGGEPTLIQSNRNLLRELIERKKTDLLVSFTTNLTVIDEELLEMMSHFKNIEINVYLFKTY